MGGWQYTNSFVIQFRTDADVRSDSCAGRIEHVASSRSSHFGSLEELLTFVNQVLKDVGLEEQRSSKPL
jgi:hypothetical protein